MARAALRMEDKFLHVHGYCLVGTRPNAPDLLNNAQIDNMAQIPLARGHGTVRFPLLCDTSHELTRNVKRKKILCGASEKRSRINDLDSSHVLYD